MSSIYEQLAAVLTYPGKDYQERVRQCAVAAQGAAAEELIAFSAEIAALNTTALQELFTVTFDLNPVCSLEIGWHLFGENYDRGLLLVRLRGEMRRCGLRETSELTDHLSNVLPLIARLEHDAAADFIGACLQPALSKMLAALCGKNNAYEHVLKALAAALYADFPELPLTVAAQPELRVLAHGAAS